MDADRIPLGSRLLGSAAAAAVLAFAPAVGALEITGFSLALLGINSADELIDVGNNRAQISSSTSVLLAPGGPVPDTVGSSTQFQTQYASLLAVDRDGPGVGGTVSRTMTSAYQITFTVDNPTGGTYQVDIDTLRVGALTNVDDDAAGSTQTLGAVIGSVDAVVNASLALAGVGPFATTTTGTTTFSQSGTTLSISDSALSRTFVLSFDWISSAISSQDEVGIRMGTSGSLSTTTADDYPGEGLRTASGDGHFVTVTTTLLNPEPHTSALLALGLLGLAAKARIDRRARSVR